MCFIKECIKRAKDLVSLNQGSMFLELKPLACLPARTRIARNMHKNNINAVNVGDTRFTILLP